MKAGMEDGEGSPMTDVQAGWGNGKQKGKDKGET